MVGVLQLRRDSNLNSKFKFSCLIASTKFQTTMGAFHNLNLVSKYLILHSNVFALSILWMVYYYNAILLRVKHKGCCCDFCGFWGFNGEIEDLFLHCLLAVLEVCDNERGVLRKEFEPEMCGEQIWKGKKDNKEYLWHQTTSSFLTR